MDLLWKQSNPFPVSCCFAFAVFVKGKTFHVTHNYDHCNCVEFTAIRQSAYVNSFIWTHLMSSQIFCLEGDTSLEMSAAEKNVQFTFAFHLLFSPLLYMHIPMANKTCLQYKRSLQKHPKVKIKEWYTASKRESRWYNDECLSTDQRVRRRQTNRRTVGTIIQLDDLTSSLTLLPAVA